MNEAVVLHKLEITSKVVEIVVKAIIGAAVGLGLWFGQGVLTDIKQGAADGNKRDTKIAVLEQIAISTDKNLEKLDKKLDIIWSEVRRR